MEYGRFMVAMEESNFEALKDLAQQAGGWKQLVLRGAKSLIVTGELSSNTVTGRALDAIAAESAGHRRKKVADDEGGEGKAPAAKKGKKAKEPAGAAS